jgi:two-component system response regulator FixJ
VPPVRKISIVDDDESLRTALRGLLRSAGFEASTFASAREFLESPERLACACLILDVRMPGMSGLELQRRLSDSGSTIPIVFISAHSDEESRARALEKGAVAFLKKPFSDEALLNAIAAATGTPASG